MLYKALASLAWLLLIAGWAARRKRKVHVPLVLAGIGLDLALVLILEFSRDVIGMTFAEDWSALQITHIATSAAAVLFYLPTLAFGFQLLRRAGDIRLRARHRVVALAALLLRTVGFVCMWWI